MLIGMVSLIILFFASCVEPLGMSPRGGHLKVASENANSLSFSSVLMGVGPSNKDTGSSGHVVLYVD